MDETLNALTQGIAMVVESLHTTIGVAYLLAWLLIGQVAIRRPSPESSG